MSGEGREVGVEGREVGGGGGGGNGGERWAGEGVDRTSACNLARAAGCGDLLLGVGDLA